MATTDFLSPIYLGHYRTQKVRFAEVKTEVLVRYVRRYSHEPVRQGNLFQQFIAEFCDTERMLNVAAARAVHAEKRGSVDPASKRLETYLEHM